MTNLFLLLAVVAGAGVAIQAVVNARLSVPLGAPIWAAVTQFVVGLLLLLLMAALTRQPAPITAGLARLPWWLWTGGFFGALFIFVVVVLTPRLGAGLTIACTIVGQLVAAVAIDHYGWFGAGVVRLSAARIVGAVLLVVGVILIRWR